MTSDKITPVSFKAQKTVKLDLDIVQISDLRQRANYKYLLAYSRIEFHQLIFVEQGSCIHTVDFEEFKCKKGSLLLMYPGQVQKFNNLAHWDGYIVIFRPEFLLSKENTSVINEIESTNKLENLPVYLQLNDRNEQALLEIIRRMFDDIHLDGELKMLQSLLISELQTLFNRLFLICFNTDKKQHGSISLAQKRYKSFRDAVERNFYRYHQVRDYTKMLSYSEKSLNRSIHEISGCSAKKYLTQRIILEAKRLLTYTDLPINLIAIKLGFEEATNFSKFFRSYEKITPSKFRDINK
jgi:AraC-like DNA-binding protein